MGPQQSDEYELCFTQTLVNGMSAGEEYEIFVF
jgi:hypothetical protein